jgi:hypothetical protein
MAAGPDAYISKVSPGPHDRGGGGWRMLAAGRSPDGVNGNRTVHSTMIEDQH